MQVGVRAATAVLLSAFFRRLLSRAEAGGVAAAWVLPQRHLARVLGAVLEIPLQWQSGMWVMGDTRTPHDDTQFMYFAPVHEQPLFSGYVSRSPSRRLGELTSIPVYRQVLALGDEPDFDDRATFDAGDLRDLGTGLVVYHRDRPQPRALDYLAGLGLPTLGRRRQRHRLAGRLLNHPPPLPGSNGAVSRRWAVRPQQFVVLLSCGGVGRSSRRRVARGRCGRRSWHFEAPAVGKTTYALDPAPRAPTAVDGYAPQVADR